MTHSTDRARLAPGASVRRKNNPEVGTVTIPPPDDDWWDTLRLRGVSASAQVLVEWQVNGQPTRTWERISQLETVTSAPPPPPFPPTAQMRTVHP